MVIPQKSICVIQQWLNMAEQIRIRHEAPSTGTARTFECLQLQLLYLFKKKPPRFVPAICAAHHESCSGCFAGEGALTDWHSSCDADRQMP